MDFDTVVANCLASQNKEELALLLREVAKIKPKVIVEIGSWRGWLLETFNQAFSPDILIGIENDPLVIDPKLSLQDNIIIGESVSIDTELEVKLRLKGREIDFLFIDADHHYEAVKADFELYGIKVRKGGIIGFHDVALDEQKWIDAGVEVCRFWKELKAMEYDTQELQGTNGTGTGILYV